MQATLHHMRANSGTFSRYADLVVGLGWSIDAIDGIPVISHDGGMLGFTSINDIFPTIGLSIIVLTNNGDTPPDNIAKDILAKLDPEFAKKRDIAAAGEDVQITAKTEMVWTELHSGTIDRSELTASLNNALTPDRVAFMHAHYAEAGTPLRWIYKGKQDLPDGSTTYSYRVVFKMLWRYLLQQPLPRTARSPTWIRNTTLATDTARSNQQISAGVGYLSA